jgi:hypothetical protein
VYKLLIVEVRQVCNISAFYGVLFPDYEEAAFSNNKLLGECGLTCGPGLRQLHRDEHQAWDLFDFFDVRNDWIHSDQGAV